MFHLTLSKKIFIGAALVLLGGAAIFTAIQLSTASPGAPTPVGHTPSQIGGDTPEERTFTGTISDKYTFPGDLEVGGKVKIGNYAVKPTCDADAQGAFVFDTANDKPYICASTGWKPLDSDGDKDGCVDWYDCDDVDASIYPGAAENCGDGIDNDCDGFVDSNDCDCAGTGICSCNGANWCGNERNGDIVYVDCNYNKCWTPTNEDKWYAAKSYCDNLEYGGFTDWILPNKDTLQNLCVSGSCPQINDHKCFGGEGFSSSYWSSDWSSKVNGTVTRAHNIVFNNSWDCADHQQNVNISLFFRCVK